MNQLQAPYRVVSKSESPIWVNVLTYVPNPPSKVGCPPFGL